MKDLNRNTDVLIVGGGPAGTSTAISLRQNSLFDVTLIDKAEFPRDKACGDGLSPGIVELVRELGLENLFENLPICDSYTIVGPDNTKASGSINETASAESPTVQVKTKGATISGGYVMPRKVFDAALLSRAEECGVKILSQHSFKSLQQDKDSITVTADTPDKKEITIRARILIGADGANSRVRSALGVPANTRKHTGIAMRAYAEFAPHSQHDINRLLFVFHKSLLPAYAWLFPFVDIDSTGADSNQKPQEMANIGVGCLVADRATSRTWFLEQLESFVDQLSEQGVHFSKISDEKTYLLPHGGKLPRLVNDRVALIGDAASMINPFSGEGIYYAMTAGHMLAQVFFADDTYSAHNEKATLKKWEDAVRKRFLKHWRHNYKAQRLMRHPKWATLLIQGMASNPKVANKAIDLMLQEGILTLSDYTRMLRGLLRTSNN